MGLCGFVGLSDAADRDKVIAKRAEWTGRPLEVALAAPGSGWGSTARGGNSSPGPCTSRTGAAGAPCSGRRHPGRRVSLKAAEEDGRWTGGGQEEEGGGGGEADDSWIKPGVAETTSDQEKVAPNADISFLFGHNDHSGKNSATLLQWLSWNH